MGHVASKSYTIVGVDNTLLVQYAGAMSSVTVTTPANSRPDWSVYFMTGSLDLKGDVEPSLFDGSDDGLTLATRNRVTSLTVSLPLDWNSNWNLWRPR